MPEINTNQLPAPPDADSPTFRTITETQLDKSMRGQKTKT
jgi:hypothetical protein